MSTPVSSSSSSGSGSIDASATQAAIQQLLQSASTPAVSFGGLVSGINTSQIVQALLAANEAPILQLQSQQAQEQSKLAHWQDLSSKLQDLHDAADTLGLQSTINAKNITFSGGVASGVVKPNASLGSFTLQIDQLATATTVGSSSAIVGSDIATSTAKLSTPVSAGTFTVDGATVTVSAGDTFDTILANINTATGNIVSGTVVNNTIKLTSSDGSAITLGDVADTSNFLTVTNLSGAPSASTVTSTAVVGTGTNSIGNAITGTDIPAISSKLPTKIAAGTFTVDGQTVTITTGDSFDTILTAISTATGGNVTGTVTDNGIQLTSGDGSVITLGSGGDTSNFLSVTKLQGQPAASTMSSSGPVGVANPYAVLDSGNLSGLQSVTQGSFTINNVTITYNSTSDTLNDVLSKINASAAGVTASYDPRADRVVLTSNKTGNVGISVADGSGNLLSRLGLTSSVSQTLGQSAKYEVNGGPAQYSLSNTVTDLVPGVNVTLTSTTTSPSTATVAQDPSVGTKAMQDFVTAYNTVVDLIKTETSYDTKTKIGGIFLGDSTVSNIQSQLDEGLFISNGTKLGLTPPYIDVSTIGLSTGPVGSAPGTTTDVQFDSDKFQAALTSDPQAVTDLVNKVFQGLTKTVNNIVQPFGVIDTVVRGENSEILDLQNQVQAQQLILDQQQKLLTSEFNSLDSQLAQLQSSSSAGASVLAALGGNSASSSSSSSTGH